MSLFELTPNLQRGIDVANKTDAAKLNVVLTRIVSKLHLHDERAFTEEEEEQLSEVLGIRAEEVPLLLEVSSFILEQAAYHSAPPDKLAKQLETVGLADSHTLAFRSAWKKGGQKVVDGLREMSVCPRQVTSTNWRLNLQMAQMSQTKLKSPSAQFEIVTATNENIRIEFTHDELLQFYNHLETVQEQLDQLS